MAQWVVSCSAAQLVVYEVWISEQKVLGLVPMPACEFLMSLELILYHLERRLEGTVALRVWGWGCFSLERFG